MEPSKTDLRNYLQKECNVDVDRLINSLMQYLELPENQIDDIDILEYKFLDTMLRTEPVEQFIQILNNDERAATEPTTKQSQNDGKTPSRWTGFGRKNAERTGGIEVIRLAIPVSERGE
jgi:hypothetical protein